MTDATPAAGAELNAAIQAETESLEWLEEVEGEEALAFATSMNEVSLAKLMNDERYDAIYQANLEIVQSSDRIPYVGVRGGELFNFWRDADNTHGLWRKTTPESYASDDIEWDIVLDVDALAEADGKNWVWRGANCLGPEYRR